MWGHVPLVNISLVHSETIGLQIRNNDIVCYPNQVWGAHKGAELPPPLEPPCSYAIAS